MNRIINFLANGLGTIWFFVFCLALDLFMLPPVIKAHSTIVWVTYLSQTVIQLLALPLLGIQARIQQANHKQVISHIETIHKHLGVKV